LNNLISFSLKRFSFQDVSEHLLKNSCTVLSDYGTYDWIYLSNFYASSNAPSGFATRQLKKVLSNLNKPYILFCEPILGSNPKSITSKTCEWTAEQRYESLCDYYKIKFGLCYEIHVCCTFKTTVTGHGERLTDLNRKMIFGPQIPGMYCQPISRQICSQTLLC
jgi:hypothetical protein